jgi:hypothetical protein
LTPRRDAGVDAQSRILIDVREAPDHVALFQTAAQKVLEVGDGQLPTADRLKRQPFTGALIARPVAATVPNSGHK